MLGVIHTLFQKHKISQKHLILQDVFETVLEHGNFKMINELYEYLNLTRIQGNVVLDNIFYNAVRKHNELLDLKDQDSNIVTPFDISEIKDESKSNFNSESSNKSSDEKSHISSPERQNFSTIPIAPNKITFQDRNTILKRYLNSIKTESEYYNTSKELFRKRTFKKSKDMTNFLISDYLTIHLDHKCEHCNKYLQYNDIISCYKTTGFYCAKCKEDILPTLIALIGKY